MALWRGRGRARARGGALVAVRTATVAAAVVGTIAGARSAFVGVHGAALLEQEETTGLVSLSPTALQALFTFAPAGAESGGESTAPPPPPAILSIVGAHESCADALVEAIEVAVPPQAPAVRTAAANAAQVDGSQVPVHTQIREHHSEGARLLPGIELRDSWRALSDDRALGVVRVQSLAGARAITAALALSDAALFIVRAGDSAARTEDLEAMLSALNAESERKRAPLRVWAVLQPSVGGAYGGRQLVDDVEEMQKSMPGGVLNFEGVLQVGSGDAVEARKAAEVVLPAILAAARSVRMDVEDESIQNWACSADKALLDKRAPGTESTPEPSRAALDARGEALAMGARAEFRAVAATLAAMPVEQRHTMVRLGAAADRLTEKVSQLWRDCGYSSFSAAADSFEVSAQTLKRSLGDARSRALEDLQGFLEEDVSAIVAAAIEGMRADLEEEIKAVRDFDTRQRDGKCCAPGIKYGRELFAQNLQALLSKHDLELRKACAKFETECEIDPALEDMRALAEAAAATVRSITGDNLDANARRRMDDAVKKGLERASASLLEATTSHIERVFAGKDAQDFAEQTGRIGVALKTQLMVEAKVIAGWEGIRASAVEATNQRGGATVKQFSEMAVVATEVVGFVDRVLSADFEKRLEAFVSSTAIGDHFTREINDQVERIKSEFDAPYEAAVKALYDFPAVQDDERNNLLELVERAHKKAEAVTLSAKARVLDKHGKELDRKFVVAADELLRHVDAILIEAAHPNGHLALPHEYRAEADHVLATSKEQLERLAKTYELLEHTSGPGQETLMAYESALVDMARRRGIMYRRELMLGALGAVGLVLVALCAVVAWRRKKRVA